MGINITQFAPPGKVSTLVWDDDMQAAPGKEFVGPVSATWLVTPITPLTYVTFALSDGSGFIRDIYQLPPKQYLTGQINMYITGVVYTPYVTYIDENWNILRVDTITESPTSYNIPEGTNGIYISHGEIPYGAPTIKLAKMDIAIAP